MPPTVRRLVLPTSAAALALSVAQPAPDAAAHALVTEAEPAAGAVLAAGPPQQVRLRFNSRIDRARSRLVLHGPDGGQTPLPLDSGNDPTLLEARTDVVPWAPGAWRLRWQVLALDGHITRGDVPFTLRPRYATTGDLPAMLRTPAQIGPGNHRPHPLARRGKPA